MQLTPQKKSSEIFKNRSQFFFNSKGGGWVTSQNENFQTLPLDLKKTTIHKNVYKFRSFYKSEAARCFSKCHAHGSKSLE
ncbi:hypothetical protein EMIT0P43_70065 [Pseudomonas jessenii]